MAKGVDAEREENWYLFVINLPCWVNRNSFTYNYSWYLYAAGIRCEPETFPLFHSDGKKQT